MLRKISTCFALIIAMSLALQGGVIDYDATLDQATSDYAGPGTYAVTSFVPSGGAPIFDTGLSANGQLRLTLAAPSGQVFKIGPVPAGATEFGFYADFWSDSFLTVPWTTTPGNSFGFQGATHSPSGPADFVLESDLDGRVHATATFLTSLVSFESLTMLFDIPADYSRFLSGTPISDVRLTVYAYFPTTYTGTNPGALAELAPPPASGIPEPGSGFLCGTAALLLTFLLRKVTGSCI